MPNTEIRCLVATIVCICLFGTVAAQQEQETRATTPDFVTIHAGKIADPYQASFDDFDWPEPLDLCPIDGSKPVGEPANYAASILIFKQRVTASRGPAEEAANLTVLGKLLLRKAKAEDDLPAYSESESVLRRALTLDDGYAPAKLALVHSLLARHGFKEALQRLTELTASSPVQPKTLAARFDCEIELGNYAQARKTLDQLMKTESSAPVLARAARLAELDGDNQQAVKLLASAIATLRDMGGTDQQLAWYHWRIGSLYFDSGLLGQSAENFRSALKLDHEDEASLVGLAKTLFAQGDVAAAVASLRKAARGEAPPVLALLGDMLAFQGKDAAAEQLWDHTEAAMREEAKTAKAAHAREVALFYADHSRNPQEAVALSRLDLQQRDDSFAHDCHAWALLKNEQNAEASAAIEKAVQILPNNNRILFHAAAIAHACGNVQQAKSYAAQIQNPKFSVVHYEQLQRFLQ